MIDEGMDFDTALKLAQDLGFAERNPEADVEGHDACRKICILASLAFGKHVYPDNVHTEGITKITLDDVKYASAYKSVIKLIGKVKVLEDGRLDILVAPMLVSKKSQLANIDYEFNGIMVRGDCTGDVVFYGKGAGKLPTASAVVADIIDCCKHLKTRKYLFWADSTNDNILPYNESETSVYLRLSAEDKATAIAKAKELFGDVTVIEPKEAIANTVAVVTPILKIEDIESKASALESSGIKVLSKIRIGDL
jgi:homoserine dehydrogenase